MTERLWQSLLHDWQVVAEYDGAYTVVRCAVCGEENLQHSPPRPHDKAA